MTNAELLALCEKLDLGHEWRMWGTSRELDVVAGFEPTIAIVEEGREQEGEYIAAVLTRFPRLVRENEALHTIAARMYWAGHTDGRIHGKTAMEPDDIRRGSEHIENYLSLLLAETSKESTP